ncbi:hypothetical protein ACFSJ3_17420 [Corallincola platygyrae]|uniref:DUF4340 domain-containing protein n=1 Tax=Corallincola platygyrae TaxID=1193278 RepID=A0ABW4XV39_9GAMM
MAMKRKQLMLFSLGIAVLMAAILQIIGGDDKPVERRFLPELQLGSDKITSVEVINSEGESLILAKKVAQGWQDESTGRKVAIMPLANLVQQLAKAKVIAAETSLPRNYVPLKMNVPGEEEGSAWKVVIRAGEEYEKEILVGALDKERGGQFIRLEEDPSVFVIDRVLPLPQDANTWFDN